MFGQPPMKRSMYRCHVLKKQSRDFSLQVHYLDDDDDDDCFMKNLTFVSDWKKRKNG